MLFYLSKSFGRSIESKNQECTECLRALLGARKKGQLLIYAHNTTKEKISEYLKSSGDTHHTQIFDAVSRRFREKKQLLRDLNTFVMVDGSPKGIVRKKGRFILTDPKFINNSNILQAPIFLGENLTDCELYVKRIASNFTDTIPVSMTGLDVYDRFEAGGGNTTHMPYQRHKHLMRDFCLCVIDADRNNPSSGMGDTAQFVVNVDQNGKSALCEHLVIDSYSAENLLPLEEIERQFKVGKNQAQIDDFAITKHLRPTPNWTHLPLKKGIRGKELRGAGAFATYWSEQLSNIGKKIPCCDEEDCNCILIPRIGERTLANAVAQDSPRWEKLLNDEANPQIRNQYFELSILIRSWLCIGKPIRS